MYMGTSPKVPCVAPDVGGCEVNSTECNGTLPGETCNNTNIGTILVTQIMISVLTTTISILLFSIK